VSGLFELTALQSKRHSQFVTRKKKRTATEITYNSSKRSLQSKNNLVAIGAEANDDSDENDDEVGD
jgi:hypothetical protein